ncbi:membrane protein [Gordonia phage Linetti]|nr:membrane protein [Gordonia phage Linetti]
MILEWYVIVPLWIMVFFATVAWKVFIARKPKPLPRPLGTQYSEKEVANQVRLWNLDPVSYMKLLESPEGLDPAKVRWALAGLSPEFVWEIESLDDVTLHERAYEKNQAAYIKMLESPEGATTAKLKMILGGLNPLSEEED